MSVILFCEDDPAVQKLIRMALRNSVHDVHIAENGKEGLRMAKELRPIVLFSDVAMPLMDGFQLAEALHADPTSRASRSSSSLRRSSDMTSMRRCAAAPSA